MTHPNRTRDTGNHRATRTSLALADTLSWWDERLQLTLGVRQQRVRNKSFSTTGAVTANYDRSAVTPAVGIVVNPWQQPISLYANDIEGLPQGATVTDIASQYINSQNTLRVPNFTVIDIGARYATQLGGKDVVLRAAIDNAFDRRYWLGGFGEGYAQVGAGKRFLLSASVDF